ncbi:MAG: (Fe-S)-binding protein [Bacteroidota bacterium]
MISIIVFIIILSLGILVFARKIKDIRGSIGLGRDIEISDNKKERWKTMARVALGQSKMVNRPIAGLFHIIIYLGFILINIEVFEIVIDGLTGGHRVFAPFLGSLYDVIIGFFEVLALLVLVACLVFLYRRNIQKLKRFHLSEMIGWPKLDGNLILVIEIVLMMALLTMNANDQILQSRGVEAYGDYGSFPISQFLVPFFSGFETPKLIIIERIAWWFHIIGILIFLNYVPYSKHFHIMLAFPNTYYSNLNPKGSLNNLQSVKKEVQLMMDPNANPYATPSEGEQVEIPSFGVKDITDLTWKNLLDSYTCTECGRCSSSCPANITGKKLSPRKIVMDVRDRTDELYAFKKKNGKEHVDDKNLFDYITEEELWACTSCNACVDECPVNINPLEVILEMRRYLIMEQSKSPESITSMFNNVENNGAPWAFSPSDRLKWIEES